jgi:hypothetical protein
MIWQHPMFVLFVASRGTSIMIFILNKGIFTVNEGFFFSLSPTFVAVVIVFDDSYFDWGEIES